MSRFLGYFRLMRAGFIMMREGVIAAMPVEGMPAPMRFVHRFASFFARQRAKGEARSTRLSRAINKLGPSYIKLGQFLATRPDIVGQAIAADLALLQDCVETFPQNQAIAQIEASLGRKIDALFVEFMPPVAAASMAQVHPAIIEEADGTRHKVAVKVVRPGVRARFSRDLRGFFMLARLAERFLPEIRRLRPLDVVENLAQTTKLELDLRLEAAALSELGDNIAKDEGFRVPQVDWARTGRDVLVMEWVDGIKMSDHEALKASGFDLEQLAVTLMQSFLRHTLRDGFFHADMHPGNLFVDEKGIIVAVDLGITGRLGRKEQLFLAQILYGFISRDYTLVARTHFDAGYVPAYHDVASFAQANRAIGEPIHGQSAQTISMARLLSLLFEVTELFDMQTRPELLLLQKTMVVVEGVARTLDPHFNMWRAANPVVKEWISSNLGIAGISRDLRDNARAVWMFSRKMPQLLTQLDEASTAFHAMSRDGVQLDKQTVQYLAKAQSKHNRLSRIALVTIALCCLTVTLKILIT